MKENTVTRDISISGASFPCTLDAAVGERVKFACKEFDFYALAVVRNRNDAASTLHLQFIDAAFPINKLALNGQSAVDDGPNQVVNETVVTSEQFEIIGSSF